MENLSDVYYLVQIIIRQIVVYLRDFFLREFAWLVSMGEDVEFPESKLRSTTPRHITADFFVLSLICALLFLLVALSSKCAKDEAQDYDSFNYETSSVDPQEEFYCVSRSTSSNIMGCPYAYGDPIYPRRSASKHAASNQSLSAERSSEKISEISYPKRLSFELNEDQFQQTQGTQTKPKFFQRRTEEWLIRRTRSGHVYGKYPL